jgi:hypothetical protein
VISKLPTKKDIKFILAEDVRGEGPGKFSLLGVIAGERLAIGGPAPPEIPGAVFRLPSMAFVFIVSNGVGKFPGRFRLIAPDKKTAVANSAVEAVDMQHGFTTVIANAAKPFIGPAFGTYTVQLEIGKAKFKFPLLIDKIPEQKQKAK